MANQNVNLPAPAGNGSGAAVDVSTFGGFKTFTVAGNGGVFEPFVLIEMSNEAAPTKWAPVVQFTSPGESSLVIAARWMRATVANYRGGGAPTVSLGGDDSGATFATLIAPAGNTQGAGVDTSALPAFKTITVGGAFRGALNIEVSEDAGATYSTVLTFTQPGQQSIDVVADFMRVSRNGVPLNSPGLPVVNIGAVSTGGGGADGFGVNVEDDGTPVLTPATTLNFIGDGVTATDAGGGVADVTIPGDGNAQRFNYEVTGSEPDLENLVIPLPAIRSSSFYQVQATMGTFTSILPLAVPVITRTASQFVLALAGPATAGDTFDFIVSDLSTGNPMASVDQDPVSGRYVPSTLAQWTTTLAVAGIASGNPSALWLMQEAAGDLADSIGAFDFIAGGVPHYQQAIPGWDRLGVTLDEALANRFTCALAPGNTTSALILLYAAVTATPAVTARQIAEHPNVYAEATNAPVYRANGGTLVDGTVPVPTTIAPVIIRSNVATSAEAVIAGGEVLVPTWSPSGGSTIALGSTTNTGAPLAFVYGVAFLAGAAQMSNADLTSLLTTLNW